MARIKQDIFSKVGGRLLDAITNGDKGEYSKPWKAISKGYDPASRPVNLDGRAYHGCNIALIAFEALDRGMDLTLPVGTYKAAQEAGYQVRKGSRGVPIFFWKVYEVEDEDTGEVRRRFCPKAYTVFFAEDMDGFDADAWRAKHGRQAVEAEDIKPVTFEELAHGEQLFNEYLKRAGGHLEYRAGDKACFSPMRDTITLPLKAQFNTGADWLATLAHEAVHHSGAEARLNRKFGRRFADASYRNEELCAEAGAAMLCGFLGVHDEAEHIEPGHVGYLASWLSKMDRSKACEALVDALGKAHKAACYITEDFGDEVEVAE